MLRLARCFSTSALSAGKSNIGQAGRCKELTSKDYSWPESVGLRGGVGDGDEGANISSQAAAQLTALHALLPPRNCLQLL